jgi:hypothetical protein
MSIPEAIQSRLSAAGVTNTMPGWRIIENARLLPPLPGSGDLFGDSVQHALQELMRSFYDYGRLHWTWTQSAGVAAADGGLVRGVINAVACGSFNRNFKWLAETGLGITGITSGSENSQFLTMPGSVGIDSRWVGNVRTSTQVFSDLKCFKFSGHYWVIHGGVHYDVCYNRTFANANEIIWTKLLRPDRQLLGKGGLREGDFYKLEKPVPKGDYLVKLPMQGPSGWPSWQIVTRAQVDGLR